MTDVMIDTTLKLPRVGPFSLLTEARLRKSFAQLQQLHQPAPDPHQQAYGVIAEVLKTADLGLTTGVLYTAALRYLGLPRKPTRVFCLADLGLPGPELAQAVLDSLAIPTQAELDWPSRLSAALRAGGGPQVHTLKHPDDAEPLWYYGTAPISRSYAPAA